MEEKGKPISATLREMEVGQIISFPAEQTCSVKTMCSNLGFQINRRFTTSINREKRTLDVTRVE